MKNEKIINTNLECNEASFNWLCMNFDDQHISEPEEGMFYVILVHPSVEGNKILVTLAEANSRNVLETTAIRV